MAEQIQETLSRLGIPLQNINDLLGDVPKDEATQQHASAWIKEYLTSETLLSVEEVRMYDDLSSNVTSRSLQQNHSLDTLRPFPEYDIKNAIDALEMSTDSIERQSESLRIDLKHFKVREMRQNEMHDEHRKKLAMFHRRRALERQQIDGTSTELVQDIEARLEQRRTQLFNESRSLHSMIVELIQDDDCILHLAEKLLSGSMPAASGEIRERAAKLTNRLADLRKQEVSHRLDRIYLESVEKALSKASYDDGAVRVQSHETGLLGELESLNSEVEVLALMAAQQESQQPVLRALAGEQQEVCGLRRVKFDHAIQLLAFVSDRIMDFGERLELYNSYQSALLSIRLNFASQPDALGGRTPVTDMPPKSDYETASQAQDIPQLPALLQQMGISRDETTESDNLAKCIDDKIMRTLDSIRALSSNSASSLDTVARSASNASQLLSDALHTESVFGTVTLTDKELQRDLLYLQEQVALATHAISELDIAALSKRDLLQEKFLDRWSRRQ